MVKLALTPLFLKKISIISLTVAIVSIYIYARLSNIRSSLRSGIAKYRRPYLYEYNYRLKDLFYSCSIKNGLFLINYQKHDILASVNNLVELKNGKHAYGYQGLFIYGGNRVDCCRLDSKTETDCEEVDIREFIVRYFKEIVKPERGIFELVSRTGQYRFTRDPVYEYTYKEKTLRTGFGMMIMFALGSESYIDVDFTDSTFNLIFGKDDVKYEKYLESELPDLDPEQYETYRNIRQMQTFGSYKNYSLNPFHTELEYDYYSNYTYTGYSYPYESAANDLFRRPYMTTVNLVCVGVKLIKDIYSSIKLDILRDVMVDSKSSIDNFALLDWKDHSKTDSYCKAFWKALKRASFEQRFLMFRSISGWENIPRRDFSRIPSTQIIADQSFNEIVLQKPFVILVPSYKSENEMLELILKFIEKYQ